MRLSSAPFSRSSASCRREWRPETPAASSRINRRAWGLAEMISPIWPWRTSEGERAPVEASANRSCTSRARTSLPLPRWVEPLSRSMRLVTSSVSESLKAAGARRSELLSTSPTSALLREGRLPVPEKITSSMPDARMFLYEFSPITQRRASTRFDLPQPFGPTTPVRPGSILNSALSQKLLKPVRRKRSNFIVLTLRSGSAHFAPLAIVSPARIIFREAYAGLSGHRGVAQSTPTLRKLVRNRGIAAAPRPRLAANGPHLQPIRL